MGPVAGLRKGLRELEFFRLEKRRFWKDRIVAFPYLKEGCWKDEDNQGGETVDQTIQRGGSSPIHVNIPDQVEWSSEQSHCLTCPHLLKRVGLDDLQWSLPSQTILDSAGGCWCHAVFL